MRRNVFKEVRGEPLFLHQDYCSFSHSLSRHKIDGPKQIIQNPGEKERVGLEKCEFEDHDVVAMDVLVSTGEAKAREGDQRTTVYKKADDLVYQLKMKMSRTFKL